MRQESKGQLNLYSYNVEEHEPPKEETMDHEEKRDRSISIALLSELDYDSYINEDQTSHSEHDEIPNKHHLDKMMRT